MKVIQETPNQLTLRLRPWFAWWFGATFTTAGLLLPVLGAQVHSLKCRRIEAEPEVCEVSWAGPFWSTQRVLPLSTIQGTRIDVRQDKENKAYRVMLVTSEGEVAAIDQDLLDSEQVQMHAQQIEAFLNDSQATELAIEEDYRLMSYVLGGFFGSIFVLLGLTALVLWGKVVTCAIDKTLGALTLQYRGLLGQTQKEYRLQDILRVVIEKYRGSKGSISYGVALVMQSGDRVQLMPDGGFEFKETKKLAAHLSTFLGVELKRDVDKQPSFQEAASMMQHFTGLAFMGQEKRQAKLNEMRRTILDNPNDADTHYLLGYTLYYLKQQDEAKPSLERAKQLYSLEGQGEKAREIDVLLKAINRR